MPFGRDHQPRGLHRRRLPPHRPRSFPGRNFERSRDVVREAVREAVRLAAAKGVTASHPALAWVMRQGAVPIPGTKRRRYLEEKVAATDITVTAEDLAAIEAGAPRRIAAGERYAPALMSTLNG
ncbi:aldo/keto reductase [Streptomyces sp. NPDC006632]|uniref:aldo/keto reductase n=1 Tax=Streptomyces sp. NPDC006632 TaxID=3157182 RepID=UPI0033A1600B